jgi:hypothetical protein
MIMRRFVIKTGITALMVLLIAIGLDVLITRNLHCSNARMFQTYNEIYFGNGMYDAIIMGSSRGQVQYSPAILDSILGVDSYNISVDGRCIDAEIVMYHVYRQHKPKPKLIIQNIDWGALQGSNMYEREQYLPYLYMDDLYEQTRESEQFSWADRYLPLVRYAGYTEVIKEGLCLKNKLVSPAQYKGYIAHEDEWDGSTFNGMATIPFDCKPVVVEMFDEYLAQCKEEGIQVVLVYAPIYIGVTEKIDSVQSMFDLYQSFADRYDFPILNYTYDSICYDTDFFYNATHLNKKGAELFSVKLAKDLEKLYLK